MFYFDDIMGPMVRPTPNTRSIERDHIAHKHGRGSVNNASGRFEQEKRSPFDDGWDDGAPQPVQTHVTEETPRSIVTTNRSPDISFEQSINPYRGCEHGCSYCYARPTHAYMGLSPGLDFERRLFAKPQAAELLREELQSRSYVPKVIAIGTNTDPYQPIERDYQITRSILKVLAEFNHPVAIVTKSHLVTRDIDILAPMARKNLAKVCLSVTTLDSKLSRAMEPRASTPLRRLSAITQLTKAGIPTGIMMAPVIPALNEAEIESVLESCAEAGATSAGYIMLRLPLEVRHLFKDWIEALMPNRAAHIMRLVEDIRGGKAYESEWGLRMRGRGAYAKMIKDRFHAASKRLGLNANRLDLDTSQFRCVAEKDGQLTLF